MNISVLVPTYRRPDDLRRCLEALRRQSRPADEVLVAVRDSDAETAAFLVGYQRDCLPLRVVFVHEPGVIAAMEAGLAEALGDVFALTDDDAAPYPDWLARMEAHLAANPRLGGVGGRDCIHYGNGRVETGTHPVVGRVRWYGRVIGNHHLGAGEAREVDLLKGVNCAYRTAPLRQIGFDRRLLGRGAQVHWELGLGLALKRAGWSLLYDPAIGVDHHIAQRFDEDVTHRGGFHPPSLRNAAHNETLFLLEHLSPLRRAAFLLWAFALGTREGPGCLQVPRLLARRVPNAASRLRAVWAGRFQGLSSYHRRAAPSSFPHESPGLMAARTVQSPPAVTAAARDTIAGSSAPFGGPRA